MTAREKLFVETVWEYYRCSGRHNLPWRRTKTPYRILMSEVMLQQTQVERVIPKYREFLKRFPTVHSLALASLGDVLRVWQGLGYNRRAKMLHECARAIVEKYKGTIPKTHEGLCTLPGVGPYTASAVLAFAYNIPTPTIETNIRTVYLYHFFRNRIEISDSEIIQRIKRTIDNDNPREWYYALMDYGAFLKRTKGNQNLRSRHYTQQTKFVDSDREVRGAILRELARSEKSMFQLTRVLSFSRERLEMQVAKLQKEGLITTRKKHYTLP